MGAVAHGPFRRATPLPSTFHPRTLSPICNSRPPARRPNGRLAHAVFDIEVSGSFLEDGRQRRRDAQTWKAGCDSCSLELLDIQPVLRALAQNPRHDGAVGATGLEHADLMVQRLAERSERSAQRS